MVKYVTTCLSNLIYNLYKSNALNNTLFKLCLNVNTSIKECICVAYKENRTGGKNFF
jgi:hypothetical protein